MNARKLNVLKAAHRLFIDKGFAFTSIQDILDESGISKGTFYNYFSSKNECLMAILEFVRDETFARRHELAVGKDKSNRDVLIDQIAERIKINKENNMFALFESIYYANDPDLKKFVKKQHASEVEWVATRLEDIHGPEMKPYALDAAVMLMGIIQHIMQVQVFHTEEEYNAKKLITYTLDRIDAIIQDVVQKGDSYFNRFALRKDEASIYIDNKNELIKYIQQTAASIEEESLHKGIQFIDFLVQELLQDNPREFLIESVNRSIREVFESTAYRTKINELVTRVWQYMSQQEKIR